MWKTPLYPLRYGRAMVDINRARSIPPDADFERSFAFARDRVGMTQQEDEMRWLWHLVREQAPRRLLEIGVALGGTLFLWTRAAARDAHLVAIDTRPAGPFGLASPFPVVRRHFALSSQRIDLLLGTDSHEPRSLARVEGLLDGAPLDFLFIDGDHSQEGVAADFEMYSPLVRPGGLVAFHDVAQWSTPLTAGVARFWSVFAAEHLTEERVAGTEPGFGIGIYRVPAGPTT